MQSEIMTKYALDISKIEKNLDRIKDAKLKQYDLRYTHLMCMVKIRQSKEGLTSTEISHICFIDKAFVSRITNELIQRDLIKTNEKFDDGRKYKHKYILTDKANQIINDIIQSLTCALNMASLNISYEDLRTFYKVLNVLNENIETSVDEVLS